MSENERVYRLSELGVGDVVKVANITAPQTELSGVISKVIADPPGIEIQGIPFLFNFPSGPNVSGWRVVDHEPAIVLPVDPGLYIGSNRQIVELTADGSWLISGLPAGSADVIRSIMPLEPVAPVAETAAAVIQTVREAVAAEVHTPTLDALDSVAVSYGLDCPPRPEESPVGE